jgi:outer membrane cobalamin receptor
VAQSDAEAGAADTIEIAPAADEDAGATEQPAGGAETGEIDLGQTEVLGSRSLLAVLDDQRALTIIPGAELGAATSVAEALERVPGVDARSAGGLGQLSTAQVRGARARQVLVLIDGLPVAPGAETDLSLIPLGAIDHVEVLRGPEAARFGQGALGGVVNFVTRSNASAKRDGDSSGSQTTLAELELLGGSHGAYGADMEVDAPGAHFSGTHQQSANDFTFMRADGSRAVRDNNQARLDALRASFQLAGVDQSFSLTRLERGVPGSAEFPTLRATLEEQQLTWQAGPPERRLGLVVSREEFDDPQPYLMSGPVHSVDTRTHAEYGWASGPGALARWHVKPRLDYIRSSDYGEKQRLGADLGGIWHRRSGAGEWQCELGLTASSDVGADPVGRVSWGRQLGAQAEAYAAVAYAVRHPDFSELYLRGAGPVQGDPGLQPERALNCELGCTLTSRRAIFDTAAFYTDYEDSIIFAPVSAYLVKAMNTGRARIAGAEALLDWRLAGPCWWRTAYTWLPVAEYASGTPLTGRAGQHLNSRLEWHSGRAHVALAADHSSSMPADLLGNLRLKPRTVWNIELGSSLGSGDLSILLNNVFNTNARDSWNYPLPGREVYLQWKVKL